MRRSLDDLTGGVIMRRSLDDLTGGIIMRRSLDDLTGEMELWIGRILPDRDPFDTATKIVEEASELLHALHHGGNVAEEAADILVLLLDVALLAGFDLQTAFEEKMVINRNRKWKHKQGTLTHEGGG